MKTSSVWVLTKLVEYDHDSHVTVLGAYATRELMLAKVDRIEKANSQYPLRENGDDAWVIGPEEYEGWFGNRPVYLKASKVKLEAGDVDDR